MSDSWKQRQSERQRNTQKRPEHSNMKNDRQRAGSPQIKTPPHTFVVFFLVTGPYAKNDDPQGTPPAAVLDVSVDSVTVSQKNLV